MTSVARSTGRNRTNSRRETNSADTNGRRAANTNVTVHDDRNDFRILLARLCVAMRHRRGFFFRDTILTIITIVVVVVVVARAPQTPLLVRWSAWNWIVRTGDPNGPASAESRGGPVRADRNNTCGDPYRGARPTSRGRRSAGRCYIWVTHAGRSVGTCRRRKKNWFRDTVPYKRHYTLCLLFYSFSFLHRYSVASKRPDPRYNSCFIIIMVVLSHLPSSSAADLSYAPSGVFLCFFYLSSSSPPFFLRASLALGRSNGAATPSAQHTSRVAPTRSAPTGPCRVRCWTPTKFERSGQGEALYFFFFCDEKLKKKPFSNVLFGSSADKH